MTNIVLIGHVCIDHNVVRGELTKSWGSPLMYIGKYFNHRHAEANVTLIAPHGRDFNDYNSNLKVLTSTNPDDPTMLYKNVVDEDGNRTQYCLNSEHSEPTPLTDEMKSVLAEADIVFVAPLSPQYSVDYVRQAFSETPLNSLKVLLPQGYLRYIAEDGLVSPRPFNEAKDLLPLFNLVVLSDEDTTDAVNKAVAWQQQSSATTFIVTENKRGAVIIGDGGQSEIPTEAIPQKNIINPIGCGDVFTAATAYGLSDKLTIEQAVIAGHGAARESLLSDKLL